MGKHILFHAIKLQPISNYPLLQGGEMMYETAQLNTGSYLELWPVTWVYLHYAVVHFKSFTSVGGYWYGRHRQELWLHIGISQMCLQLNWAFPLIRNPSRQSRRCSSRAQSPLTQVWRHHGWPVPRSAFSSLIHTDRPNADHQEVIAWSWPCQKLSNARIGVWMLRTFFSLVIYLVLLNLEIALGRCYR